MLDTTVFLSVNTWIKIGDSMIIEGMGQQCKKRSQIYELICSDFSGRFISECLNLDQLQNTTRRMHTSTYKPGGNWLFANQYVI